MAFTRVKDDVRITIGIKSIYFPFTQFCIFEITQLRNTIGLFGEISGYLSDHIDLCINGFYTIGYSYHAYKSWEEEALTMKFIYNRTGIKGEVGAVLGKSVGHIENGERVIDGPIYSYLDIAWYHFLK